MAKKKRTTARRSRGLAGASIEDLHREIERRRKNLGRLETKRAKILAQLAEVESEIDAIETLTAKGGARRGGGRRRAGAGRKRPRNDMNLVDSLHKVLRGKEMSVTEVAQAVQDAGYKTSSENFRTIVNQQLIAAKNKKLFKKVSRGVYTAK